MVKVIGGNLLDAKEDYICHQVNCQGRMASGVAKAIRAKWPEVYPMYLSHIDMTIGTPLGTICPVETKDGKTIINMFAQSNYGYDGKRYTSYDMFYRCLTHIAELVPKDKSIAFPYGIGCGLGGGNWNIIYGMIEEVLGEWDVSVYLLADIREEGLA